MQNFWADFVSWLESIWNAIYNWLLVTPENSKMNNLTRFIIALIVLVVGRYLVKLVMRIAKRISGVSKQIGVDVSVKTFTLALVNLILNILLAIAVLSLLQVDISSMASVFSSAVVAVGLSLQDLISAFASGVVLLKAKHFRTGDYIKIDHAVGSCEGTVSSVGLISSTLETFENQHVVIPNNMVLQGVITNYSLNPTRRLTVDIGVDYSTDTEKCKKVMLDVVKADKRILTNPTPIVAVLSLDEFTITFRVICYTKIEVYWDVFYDIREKMLLAYRANDISIPFKHVVVEDYHGSDTEHQAIMLKQSKK